MALAPLLLMACGGAGDKPETSSATAVESVVATPGAPAPVQSSAPATDATPGAVAKVSANNASIDELAAAFDAAGIANGSRWAREVDEYRPYDETDPTMGKLRQNLAKYNPGPGVVDAIIAVLSLP
ncbi:MAG: hypothetical protein AB7H85_11055 [Dehalococcoidia bacterium]